MVGLRQPFNAPLYDGGNPVVLFARLLQPSEVPLHEGSNALVRFVLLL